MSRLNGFLAALSVNRLHRFSKCWKLEREDGVNLFFTDHDVSLEIDGDTYVPGSGGLLVSAAQSSDSTQAGSTEARGMINASSITEDDLKARKYDGCKITEFIVDFRFPFAGRFVTSVFYIENLKYNGRDVWSANLSSQRMKLAQRKGRQITKDCRFSFGDSDCAVYEGSYQSFSSVSTVKKDRLTFETSLVVDDGYFDYGKLEWLSGDNTGIISEVKWNIGSEIELQTKTPFSIQVGEFFTITAGCDRSYDTCMNKFGNVINFGGDPFIPGTDKAGETP